LRGLYKSTFNVHDERRERKRGRRGDGKGGERKERREKEKGSVPGSFSQILALVLRLRLVQ